MAIIQDAELEAGFQVMIRWYVSTSQRYPADENEYYTTFFNVLEPNQAFELVDPNFDEDAIRAKEEAGGEEDPLEFIIRDVCYVQTLTPQFVAFHYTYPGYIRRTFLTQDADLGATTLTVDDVSSLSNGARIAIGPQQGDVYTIDTVTNAPGTGSDIITLTTSLTKSFLSGTDINEDDGTAVPDYPDNVAATGISRILSHENPEVTSSDPLEANTPLYYDTGETVLRYYYTNNLEVPFNGARGFGETTDRAPLTYRGQQYTARWWAISDVDETAAQRACLIDNQGIVIECRDGSLGFDHNLSYSSTSETAACTALVNSETEFYYGDHAQFIGELEDAADPTSYEAGTGLENFVFPNTQSPPQGYYAGEATTGGLTDNYVRFWNGTQFLEGIVDEGLWDNCPQPLGTFVQATLYSTELNIVCNLNQGQSLTLYYSGGSFTANNVTAIYTDAYGSASDAPSQLGTTYLRVTSGIYAGDYLWDGSNLTNVTGGGITCSTYCGDPSALNAQSSPGANAQRDDSLCSYATGVCTDTSAITSVTANPPNTFSDNSLCDYVQYTASFDVTNNLTGDPAGYIINADPQTGDNGSGFDITLSVGLEIGFAWSGDPFVSVNETGTFNGEDETFPVTITGTIIDTTLQAGCNTMGAVNYVAGTDGSEACYFSLGEFTVGTGDISACVGNTFGITTTLATNDQDNKVRVINPDGSIEGGANGWFSDGTNYFRYSGGDLVSEGTCPSCEGASLSVHFQGSQASVFGLSCTYTITSTSGGVGGPGPSDQGAVEFGSISSPREVILGSNFPGDYEYYPTLIYNNGANQVVCSGTGVGVSFDPGSGPYTPDSCPSFTNFNI